MKLIKTRDVRLLDIDGLRALNRVASNQLETFNTGAEGQIIDAQAILDMHWAADDNGGWIDFQRFWEEDNERALACFLVIEAAARTRGDVARDTEASCTTWDLVEISSSGADLPAA